eukprot:765727-Hanusia_phi.AAC.1
MSSHDESGFFMTNQVLPTPSLPAHAGETYPCAGCSALYAASGDRHKAPGRSGETLNPLSAFKIEGRGSRTTGDEADIRRGRGLVDHHVCPMLCGGIPSPPVGARGVGWWGQQRQSDTLNRWVVMGKHRGRVIEHEGSKGKFFRSAHQNHGTPTPILNFYNHHDPYFNTKQDRYSGTPLVTNPPLPDSI